MRRPKISMLAAVCGKSRRPVLLIFVRRIVCFVRFSTLFSSLHTSQTQSCRSKVFQTVIKYVKKLLYWLKSKHRFPKRIASFSQISTYDIKSLFIKSTYVNMNVCAVQNGGNLCPVILQHSPAQNTVCN